MLNIQYLVNQFGWRAEFLCMTLNLVNSVKDAFSQLICLIQQALYLVSTLRAILLSCLLNLNHMSTMISKFFPVNLCQNLFQTVFCQLVSREMTLENSVN